MKQNNKYENEKKKEVKILCYRKVEKQTKEVTTSLRKK